MTSNQAAFWWLAVTACMLPMLSLVLAVLVVRAIKRALS